MCQKLQQKASEERRALADKQRKSCRCEEQFLQALFPHLKRPTYREGKRQLNKQNDFAQVEDPCDKQQTKKEISAIRMNFWIVPKDVYFCDCSPQSLANLVHLVLPIDF